MGWESSIVRSELRGLQYNDRQTGTQTGPGANSTVLVEFTNLSFHFRSPGDLSPGERDFICSFLNGRVKKQEEAVVEKLHLLHSVLNSVACEDYYECVHEESSQSQSRLKSLIHRYFEDGLDCESLAGLGITVRTLPSEVDPELLNRVARISTPWCPSTAISASVVVLWLGCSMALPAPASRPRCGGGSTGSGGGTSTWTSTCCVRWPQRNCWNSDEYFSNLYLIRDMAV